MATTAVTTAVEEVEVRWIVDGWSAARRGVLSRAARKASVVSRLSTTRRASPAPSVPASSPTSSPGRTLSADKAMELPVALYRMRQSTTQDMTQVRAKSRAKRACCELTAFGVAAVIFTDLRQHQLGWCQRCVCLQCRAPWQRHACVAARGSVPHARHVASCTQPVATSTAYPFPVCCPRRGSGCGSGHWRQLGACGSELWDAAV